MYRRALKVAGYAVVGAEGGIDAREKAPPNLIALD
jgi:hypothetical protein